MKNTVHDIATHHNMSRMAYRVHLLGMCVRVMRSFLFNVVVFFAGASIGMGFTVMKMQKMWQENDDVKTYVALTKGLKHHKIHDKAIDNCLIHIQQHNCNTNNSKNTTMNQH